MLKIDNQKCVKCGKCVLVCKHGIFKRENPDDFPSVIEDAPKLCTRCGHCVAVCPAGAIFNEYVNVLECIDIPHNSNIGFEDMNVFLRSRRSCRNYKQEPVSGEIISKILNTARYAPTAKNCQDVNVVVVTGHEKIKSLGEMVFGFYGSLIEMLENPLKKLLLTAIVGAGNVSSLQKSRELFKYGVENWRNGVDYLFYDAPAVILTHADKNSPLPKDNCDYAMMTMLIAAESLGLGTCINGFLSMAAAKSKEIKKFLEIPAKNEVYNAMTLGFPSVKFTRTVSRKPLNVKFIK